MPAPQRKKEPHARRVESELYIQRHEGDVLQVLNTTAMFIWSLCDGEHTVGDMANVLCDVYPDLDPVTAEADTRAVLEVLAEQGLLMKDDLPQ